MTDKLDTALTHGYLCECLDYDGNSGKIFWKTRPSSHFRSTANANVWNARYAGKEAGSFTRYGYRSVTINDRDYQSHRLIWVLACGEWPIQVDHINGIRDDNRIANLRNVTNAENNRNSAMPSDNTSGAVGVVWHKRIGKWHARITVNRTQVHLGYFDDFHSAVSTRKRAERDYGFHRNHGRVA